MVSGEVKRWKGVGDVVGAQERSRGRTGRWRISWGEEVGEERPSGGPRGGMPACVPLGEEARCTQMELEKRENLSGAGALEKMRPGVGGIGRGEEGGRQELGGWAWRAGNLGAEKGGGGCSQGMVVLGTDPRVGAELLGYSGPSSP